MNRLAIAVALLAAVPALAAEGPTFRASLTGYQEVPSVSSTADGEFEARVAPDGNSFDFTLVYAGLQADVVQSHIHFAQKSVNGAIVVWLCGTPSTPGPSGTATCPGRGGTVTGTITAATVVGGPTTQQLGAGELAEVIAAMRAGVAYVNIHSTVSPGGEIRGQVSSRGNSGK